MKYFKLLSEITAKKIDSFKSVIAELIINNNPYNAKIGILALRGKPVPTLT